MIELVACVFIVTTIIIIGVVVYIMGKPENQPNPGGKHHKGSERGKHRKKRKWSILTGFFTKG